MAKIIDSTLIKPEVTKQEIEELCKEAKEYGFGCVCVNSAYVPLAVQFLKETDIKVCATVGFPFGAVLSEVKQLEAQRAVEFGARELDMVMNIGLFKSGDYNGVKEDISAVVSIKRLYDNVIVKVIIETPYLTEEEKVKACQLVKQAGADFVKTSTGLVGGANVEDIKLMRQTVGEEFGVKASGGIRTYKDALAMIEAGANRIGTSTAVAIIKGAPQK